MNGNFPRQSTRVTVFFFMKLILFFVGRVRSTGVRDTVTSRQEKFETGQKEVGIVMQMYFSNYVNDLSNHVKEL